jgi:hypothetical protein
MLKKITFNLKIDINDIRDTSFYNFPNLIFALLKNQ